MTTFTKRLQAARKSERFWLSRVKYDIAAQLQDLLKANNLNQEKYADKLGVKPPQVSRALSGNNNPTIETLVKMGWVLGYVPNVTFVPVEAKQVEVSPEADQRPNIFLTKGRFHDAYRFDVPLSEERMNGWTRCNDDRFQIAA